MKAYNRKKGTLTVTQRQVLKQCVVEEFAKHKAAYEKKCNDRIFFLHYLALAMVLDEELGFGEKRRAKILNACMAKVAEIGEYCESNKFIEGDDGEEQYDVEFNLQRLEEFAKEYNIAWDESIFVDVEESEDEIKKRQNVENDWRMSQ